MTAPRWISEDICKAIHTTQLAEHGGGEGMRDEGLLLSALARPQDMHAYEQADIATMAAAYTYGIVRNHPFVDGNKRTGFVVGILFLELNGYRFNGPEIEATQMVLSLAASEIAEADYAAWLAANSTPLDAA